MPRPLDEVLAESRGFTGDTRPVRETFGWGDRFGAAIDSAQASLLGIPEAMGSETAGAMRRSNQWDAERVRARAAQDTRTPGSFTEVDGLGSGARWLGGLAVDTAPQLAALAATGIATGPVGLGLSAAARGAVAVGTQYPFALGDVLQNQREQAGRTDLGSAAALAAPYAAVDALTGMEGRLARGQLARNTIRGLDNMPGAGGAAARTAASAGTTFLKEGAGETFQEGMNQLGRMAVDPYETFLNERSKERFTESFIAGGALGGAFGTVGGWRRSQHYVPPGRTVDDTGAVDLTQTQEQRALADAARPEFGLSSYGPTDGPLYVRAEDGSIVPVRQSVPGQRDLFNPDGTPTYAADPSFSDTNPLTPFSPDWPTTPGAAPERAPGVPFQRDISTGGLSLAPREGVTGQTVDMFSGEPRFPQQQAAAPEFELTSPGNMADANQRELDFSGQVGRSAVEPEILASNRRGAQGQLQFSAAAATPRGQYLMGLVDSLASEGFLADGSEVQAATLIAQGKFAAAKKLVDDAMKNKAAADSMIAKAQKQEEKANASAAETAQRGAGAAPAVGRVQRGRGQRDAGSVQPAASVAPAPVAAGGENAPAVPASTNGNALTARAPAPAPVAPAPAPAPTPAQAYAEGVQAAKDGYGPEVNPHGDGPLGEAWTNGNIDTRHPASAPKTPAPAAPAPAPAAAAPAQADPAYLPTEQVAMIADDAKDTAEYEAALDELYRRWRDDGDEVAQQFFDINAQSKGFQADLARTRERAGEGKPAAPAAPREGKRGLKLGSAASVRTLAPEEKQTDSLLRSLAAPSVEDAAPAPAAPAAEPETPAPSAPETRLLTNAVDSLPKARVARLEKHYGAARASAEFISKLHADVVTYVNKGAKAVAGAVRDVVKSIAEGVLAMGLVFNPAAMKQEFAFDMPTVVRAETVQYETQVRTKTPAPASEVPANAAAKMSEQAKEVYRSMASTARMTGKGFIIADKVGGMIHVFNADGSLLVQDAALFGKDKGDVMVGDSLRGGAKITPAGQYTLAAADSEDYAGGKLLRLAETHDPQSNSWIAVHAAWFGDPAEKRAERLKSKDAEDNRISYGCINTAHDLFLKKILPVIDNFNGGMIFVLPEVGADASALFKPATVDGTTTVAESRTTFSAETPASARSSQGQDALDADRRTQPGVEPKFRTRNDAPRAGRNEDIDGAIAEVQRATGVDIEVYDSPEAAGMKAPPGGALGMGMTAADGRIVLFRNGLGTRLETMRVIFHEMFHKGLRNLMSDAAYHAQMDRLFDADEQVRIRAVAWAESPEAQAREAAGMKPRDLRSLAIEEALAVLAEDLKTLKPGPIRAVANWFAGVAQALGMRELAQWLRRATLTETQRFIQDTLDAATNEPGFQPLRARRAEAFSTKGDADKIVGMLRATAEPAKGSLVRINLPWVPGGYEVLATVGDSVWTNTQGAEVAEGTPGAIRKIKVSYRAQGETVTSTMTPDALAKAMGTGPKPPTGPGGGGVKFKTRPNTPADNKVATAFAQFPGSKTTLGRMIQDALYNVQNKPWALPWVTNDQLAEGYKQLAPVQRINRATSRMAAVANKYLEKTAQTAKRWRALDDATQLAMQRVMLRTTMAEAHVAIPGEGGYLSVDEAFRHPKNAHLDPEMRGEFGELYQEWNRLPVAAKKVYDTVRDELERQHADTLAALRRQAADQYAGQLRRLLSDDELRQLSESDRNVRDMVKSMVDVAGTKAEQRALAHLYSALRDIHASFGTVRGPYFPLVRFGDNVVVMKSQDLKDLELAAAALRQQVQDASEAEVDEANQEGHDAKLESLREQYKAAREAVEAAKRDEKKYVVEFHESPADAQRALETLQAKHPEADVYRSVKEDYYRGLDGASGTFIKSLTEATEAALGSEGVSGAARESALKAIRDLYLRRQPERSALRAELKRMSIEGVQDAQMLRGYAQHSRNAAWRISRLKHSGEVVQGLAELSQDRRSADAKHVLNELKARFVGDIAPPAENKWLDRLTSGTYFMHLGFNLSYFTTNATQAWVTSLPVMAGRHGMVNASNSLMAASKDVIAMLSRATAQSMEENGTLAGLQLRLSDDDLRSIAKNDGELQMLRTLTDDGVIDITIKHDLGAVSHGTSKAGRVLELSSALANYPEMYNRLATALAAYRMEAARAQYDTQGDAQERAEKYAEYIINRTHFNYSPENAPRMMRGNLGRLLFQFKRYQQGMIYLYVKLVKDATRGDKDSMRALAYLLGAQLSVSGITGLPIAAPVALAAKLVASAYDDDDEPQWMQEWYNGMKDAVGETAAQVLAKGVGSVAGLDLSKKLGHGDIFNPVAFANTDSKKIFSRDWAAEVGFALMGPGASLLANEMEAAGRAMNGEWAKAAERGMPTFVANGLKAYNRAQDGLTTRGGDTIMEPEEFGALSVAAKAIGFESVAVTDTYDQRSAYLTAVNARRDARKALLRDYYEAAKAGDSEAMAAAREHIDAFNQRQPSDPVRQKDLAASLKAHAARAQETRGGLRVGKRDEATYQRLMGAED